MSREASSSNADGDDLVAERPRGFERENRKAAVAGDESVLHFTNPRSEVAMNSISSSIFGGAAPPRGSARSPAWCSDRSGQTGGRRSAGVSIDFG